MQDDGFDIFFSSKHEFPVTHPKIFSWATFWPKVYVYELENTGKYQSVYTQ